MALEKLLNEGTITAASVIVNTGWLDETVEILKKHPETSVGAHVCLNSEWTPYKWVPREKIKLPERSMKGAYDDARSLRVMKFVKEVYLAQGQVR